MTVFPFLVVSLLTTQAVFTKWMTVFGLCADELTPRPFTIMYCLVGIVHYFKVVK